MKRTRRSSPSTQKILTCLSSVPDGLHGYALIKQTGLASGTLYPILMRLSDRGWLDKAWDMNSEVNGPPRRIYTLTSKGRFELAELTKGSPQSLAANGGQTV